jgi:hypothetical protein
MDKLTILPLKDYNEVQDHWALRRGVRC